MLFKNFVNIIVIGLMVEIILVDDHFLVRDGIRAILDDEEQYAIVGEASNGVEALELAIALRPDIIICDIRMPGISGIDVVRELRAMKVSSNVIMLSMHDSDEYILQSINAGADGYLLKGASKQEFLKALSMVSRGEKYFSGEVSSALINKILLGGSTGTVDAFPDSIDTDRPNVLPKQPFDLTKRESQILRFAISGMTNKDIAAELNISKRTIEVHRFNLMKKMGVKNILELSNKAREYGMIS